MPITSQFRTSQGRRSKSLETVKRSPRHARWLRLEPLEERTLLALTAFNEAAATGLPNMTNSAVAWGDYDNDGRLDLLIAGINKTDTEQQAITKIFHNDGNGTFHDLEADLPAIESGAVAWADFDNDGRLDLLLSGKSSTGATTKIYRNLGADSFEVLTTALPNLQDSAVACGDYDSDGRVDILLAGTDASENGVTKLYHNDGANSFRDIGVQFAGVKSGSLAWADSDSDGKLDVLVSGTSGNAGVAKLYRNQGNGGFVEINTTLPALQQGSVAWGDYDADGKPDILLTGKIGDTPAASVYHNNGSNTFSVVTAAGLTGVSDGAGVWGDYDNDGKLDILLVGHTGSTSIARVYRNNGSGAFADVAVGLTGMTNASAAWADFNGDGRLDVLLTGQSDIDLANAACFTKIYTNASDSLAAATRPTKPTGLTVTPLSATSVKLSWTAVTGATSYELRVGTTLGGRDIVSPAADSVGLRTLAQQGAILTNTWTLNNIDVNTIYSWSVQAINSVMVGSEFASEATFALPLVILTGPTTSTTDTPSLTVTVTNPVIGVPDTLAVYIDVDLDNNGDFDGEFGNETETAFDVKTLTSGTATFDLASLGYDHTYRLRARIDGKTTSGSAITGQETNVGTSEILTMVVNFSQPTVTINKAAAQADPSTTWPIFYTVTFSETVTDFDASDLTLGGTAPGTLVAEVIGSGKNYTVAVFGMTGNGTVTASIAADQVHDELGNANTASTSIDNSVQYNVTKPTFYLTGPTTGVYQTGDQVTINWRAKDIGYNSKISLCYDEDTTWSNGNEHWIEIDQVGANNGLYSYSWDTTGVKPGQYYVGGYLFSDGKPTFSHLTRSITIQGNPTTFVLAGPSAGTYTVGQNVPIQWTASNVRSGSKVSLCYDEDTVWWNGNEHWIEIDQVTAANGKASYNWNTAGITPGTYYVAGYLWSNGKAVFSHLNTPITIQATQPTFALSNALATSVTAGESLTIGWTAGNVAAGSTVSLCYDEDTTWWNGNETWIEIDQVAAANGTGSYAWDTSDVAPGTYYIAGYLWSGARPYFSHLTRAVTVTAPLSQSLWTGTVTLTSQGSYPGDAIRRSDLVTTLQSTEQVQPIVDEAIRQWTNLLGEAATAKLAELHLRIDDLAENVLVSVTEGSLTIDRDAAGRTSGWFVDPTPADDREYAVTSLGPKTTLTAKSGNEADLRTDLLSAVMLEMEQVLNVDRVASELTKDMLPSSVRYQWTA